MMPCDGHQFSYLLHVKDFSFMLAKLKHQTCKIYNSMTTDQILAADKNHTLSWKAPEHLLNGAGGEMVLLKIIF